MKFKIIFIQEEGISSIILHLTFIILSTKINFYIKKNIYITAKRINSFSNERIKVLEMRIFNISNI